MGGYYKLKKILLILCITLTTLRIVNNSRVFAVTDVNASQASNNYTIQTDNHYETISDYARNGQLKYIWRFNELLNNSSYKTQATNTLRVIKNAMMHTNPVVLLAFQDYTVTSSAQNFFIIREIPITQLNSNSNITISGLTINSSYNFNNVPFVKFTRNSSYPNYVINAYGGITETLTSGEIQVAVPMLGQYAPEWMAVFEKAGVVTSSNEYDSILNTINQRIQSTNNRLDITNNNLNDIYNQNIQTTNTLNNTYNYLNDSNIDTISSLGFSQPNNSEDIDLTDCFDELEALLTGENYTNKSFTFSIPNNRNYTFSIAPTMLETNLTRVGGSAIISIIHAMWYIGLFGWYIFAYLGIWGKFLSGDWLHLVNHTSPVNKIVKMSVSTFGGGS